MGRVWHCGYPLHTVDENLLRVIKECVVCQKQFTHHYKQPKQLYKKAQER